MLRFATYQRPVFGRLLQGPRRYRSSYGSGVFSGTMEPRDIYMCGKSTMKPANISVPVVIKMKINPEKKMFSQESHLGGYTEDKEPTPELLVTDVVNNTITLSGGDEHFKGSVHLTGPKWLWSRSEYMMEFKDGAKVVLFCDYSDNGMSSIRTVYNPTGDMSFTLEEELEIVDKKQFEDMKKTMYKRK